MPRLIRRRPWSERMKDYLNPQDFLLWLSEEIETRDWDTESFANPLGIGLNFAFLLARSNTGARRSHNDDVFGDSGGPGWFSWFSAFVVHLLTIICIANTGFTFLRKRHYRLFENSVDVAPSTPSAQRVRVDSSPVSSSPLRFLTKIIGSETAESRSHPDPTRDVWELAVWDPLPVCLRLFCLLSPGHILVYWLFLPISSSDPHPSTTVLTTIILQILLSVQLLVLKSKFSQQIKDTAIIQKEVLNEYDIKFVHPRLNHPVRDVATQYSDTSVSTEEENKVDTYTPTTILRREFKTNPNPNYAKHIDPENTGFVPKRTVLSSNPVFSTPAQRKIRESTPLRAVPPAIHQPQFRQSTSGTLTSLGSSDGGSLGIYSHANSPLKKATSMYDIQGGRREAPRNSLQAARHEIIQERERSRSPTKRLQQAEKDDLRRRTSVPPGFGGLQSLGNDHRRPNGQL